MAKTTLGEWRFCNSRAMLSTKSLSLRMGKRYFGSVCEMRELVRELVTQSRARQNLAVAVAFAALEERCDESCSLYTEEVYRKAPAGVAGWQIVPD
jgi:hypothetical protein